MSIAGAPWARITFAFLSITLAAVLLALLLLVATQPGETAVRRLDLLLAQSTDLAPRILETVESASLAEEPRGVVETLDTLRAALRERLVLAATAIDELQPARPTLLDRSRSLAVDAFDVIDRAPRDARAAGDLRGRIAAVEANLEAFSSRLDVFLDALVDGHALHEDVRDRNFALVSDLRRRRLDDEADRVFAAVEQYLARAGGRQGLPEEEAGAMVEALLGPSTLDAPEDRRRLEALAEGLRALRPARETVREAAAALRESPLPTLLGALRDRVGADVVHRLATLGDARVVLNVYTALLLVVLVYFALRLRGSYAALGRSHEDLERRVEERTRDLAHANEELKDSQVQLVQAEKLSSVGQLVAGVMHEINTPLMYVQSNVETLVENLEDFVRRLEPVSAPVRGAWETGDARAEALRASAASVGPGELDLLVAESRQLSADSLDGLGQISDLVQSLKDFSRIDRADQESFDVREGLEKTLTITRNLTKHGIEIVRDYGEVPPILCGPSRINQVFMNLVTNAVQAMDGQGRLTLRVRREGARIAVAVADTGCGIAPEDLPRVTDPFFTTKPVGQGTGLGLSIVRRIVEEHGGELDVSSRVGQGTTITVRLPVRTKAGEEAA